MAKSGSGMLIIGMGPKPPMGDKSKGKAMGPLKMGAKDKAEKPTDSAKAAKISAASALISALDSGDAEAVNEALTTHYELCAEGAASGGDEY